MDTFGFLRSLIWDGDSVLALMDRVARAALTLVDAAEGAAVEILDDDGYFEYRRVAGSLSGHQGVRLKASQSLSGLAAAAGTAMVCGDAGSDPRVDAQWCRQLNARSIVCVPLWRSNAVVGVLRVTSSEKDAFDAATVGLLEGLGEFIGAAVSSACDLDWATSRVLSLANSPGWEGLGADRSERVAEFVAAVVRPVTIGDVSAYNRVSDILERGELDVVCQPVVDLESRQAIGFEALSRFYAQPFRPPDEWFAEAHACGLGVFLELAAAAKAIDLVPHLPPQMSLAVNAGPAMAASPAFAALVEEADSRRLVIELTEHVAIDDYPALVESIAPLREAGARLAVDDTGGGISSLTHIVRLSPDIIKLDRFLTDGIESDPVRRALASALVHFADDVGAWIVAEGIETEKQVEVLGDLGIRTGQGYHLGRPAALWEHLTPVAPAQDAAPVGE
jgi:EAL domain-containing protein (putative c-di-GMP-specific phosphodiesterase class I)